MANDSLTHAKKAKNDEFYTRYQDIDEEVSHYRDQFAGKIVYCNCDDPTESNFWRYFHNNFSSLKLKALISTHYQPDLLLSYALKYTGGNDFDMEFGEQIQIKSDERYSAGDFRSRDSLKYLEQADIVITNPPFSMFSDFITTLINYNKKFIVVGNKNSVTYKDIFPLFEKNKIWIGARNMNSDFWLYVPDGSEYEKEDDQGRHIKHIMACWFTNMDLAKRHDGLWHLGDKFDNTKAHKYYEGFEDNYPEYDNYRGINVSKVSDIPIDYSGMMGVPITFMDKLNPKEFKVLGCSYSYGDPGEPYHMTGKSYTVSVHGKNVYKRIFIKNLNPISKADDTGY